MTEDELIKRYKELIQNSSEKAPEGLWDDIARDLDRDLIAFYQQQLEENQQAAPEGIWEDLELGLSAGIITEYSAQLAQNQHIAPEAIWEGIEQVLDNELIGRYKKQLAERPEKAPAGTWQNIQHRLDIDEVWSRVAGKLNAHDRYSVLWFYASRAAAVAGLIITIGLGAWFAFDGPQQRQVALKQHEKAASQTHTESLPQTPSEEIQPETGTIILNLAATPINNIEKSPLIATTADDIAESVMIYDRFTYNPMASLQAKLASDRGILKPEIQQIFKDKLRNEPTLLPPAGNEKTEFASNQDFDNARFIGFGLSAGIKNTWLFSNQTFLALAGHNGHRTKLSLIPDLALNFRYLATPRIEIEAGFSASTNVGQSYQQYIYGRFANKDISLNYLHAELLANFRGKRSWMLGPHHIKLSSSFGFYVAGLNYASESIMGEKTNITNNYRNWDFGIILGQNVDFAVTKNLTLSPGVRLTWGMPNIQKQMPDQPEFMSKTFNRSFEFRVAFVYKLQLGQH